MTAMIAVQSTRTVAEVEAYEDGSVRIARKIGRSGVNDVVLHLDPDDVQPLVEALIRARQQVGLPFADGLVTNMLRIDISRINGNAPCFGQFVIPWSTL